MLHPKNEVLVRQIYFTGIQALPAVCGSGLFIGLIIILLITSLAGAASASTVTKILLWLSLREFGPFFTGLIILTRSGTAISTELATMKLNREIFYLEAMGIKTEEYLLKPRLQGIIFSSFVLTIYFQIVTLFGGLYLASLLSHIPFSEYGEAIIANFSFRDVFISFLKSIVFGMAIAGFSIWQGLSVKSSPTEIPQRATKAVTGGLFSLFLLDGIINLLVTLLKSS
ncbi:MAG: ABC transporter permease [Thermodesulfovibrionales bacterium]|nr:ABC transporter permease [Thermodesulfovibrionales bacterium]